MSQIQAGLPNTIFGLTYPQHRELRIKEFLAYFHVPYAKSATRVQLLTHLIAVEDQFSDQEKFILSPWLRGAGLLSDFGPTLRKAQAVGKRVAVDSEPSNSTLLNLRHFIVPFSGEQECSVCLVVRPGNSFPRKKITANCKHGSFTCLQCLSQSLEIQIKEKPWDLVACPECPAVIAYQRVKEFASPRAFKRYNQKSVLSKLQVMPNFAMCSQPKCDSGQIHVSGAKQPIMKCNACNFRTCFTHKIPWHSGLTCTEFDMLHKPQEEQEIASATYLKKNSKICPNPKCGLHVQKIDGCDHIYCTHCKYEFCWACLASYERIRKEGNTAHAQTCQYHTAQLNRPRPPVQAPPPVLRNRTAPLPENQPITLPMRP